MITFEYSKVCSFPVNGADITVIGASENNILLIILQYV